MHSITFDSLADVSLCPRCWSRSAIAPGPIALYIKSIQTSGEEFHPDQRGASASAQPPRDADEEVDATIPAAASVDQASNANQAPYMTASNAVLANCRSNSGYDPASLDVRKMYVDHDMAPSSIMTSPRLRNAVDDDIVAAAVAVVPPDVDIRNNPNNANAHPPHTDERMRSPAMADINGVITTLVCVRNDARAAGLTSRPAVMSPCGRGGIDKPVRWLIRVERNEKITNGTRWEL